MLDALASIWVAVLVALDVLTEGELDRWDDVFNEQVRTFIGTVAELDDLPLTISEGLEHHLDAPLEHVAGRGDRVIGIDAQAIDGDVRLAGTGQARGKDAMAARFGGDVTGAMVVQGEIDASGYRYTAQPTGATKLDADDLLQGGPAISVEGNVTGGILLAVAPKDSDPDKADEDSDAGVLISLMEIIYNEDGLTAVPVSVEKE